MRFAIATAILMFLFFVATAVCGQDETPVKAGDRAPEIDWTKIVRSPDSANSRHRG